MNTSQNSHQDFCHGGLQPLLIPHLVLQASGWIHSAQSRDSQWKDTEGIIQWQTWGVIKGEREQGPPPCIPPHALSTGTRVCAFRRSSRTTEPTDAVPFPSPKVSGQPSALCRSFQISTHSLINFLKKVIGWDECNKHQISLINTERSVSVLFLNHTFRCSRPCAGIRLVTKPSKGCHSRRRTKGGRGQAQALTQR